ncbi:uncharacterized protein LOC131939653 isoform X2 [Physella acuta]|nr:uncharacterized protein LOC131939653 isoform X2 [Physella acuta]
MLHFNQFPSLLDPDIFMYDSIRPARPSRWHPIGLNDHDTSPNVRIIPIKLDYEPSNTQQVPNQNRSRKDNVNIDSPIVLDDEENNEPIITKVLSSQSSPSRSKTAISSLQNKSSFSNSVIDVENDAESSPMSSPKNANRIISQQKSPPTSAKHKNCSNNNFHGDVFIEDDIDFVSDDLTRDPSFNGIHRSLDKDVDLLCDVEDPQVSPTPSYPIYSVLKPALAKESRQIDYVRGDGNCFFRALSKQLYKTDEYHKAVRNLVVDLIATNKSKFAQFVDGEDVQEHVDRMSEDHCWATTCEIYAAATLLQREIYMYTPNHRNDKYTWLLFRPVFQQSCPSSITQPCCYLTLCNTNGNHYDRVVPDHGGCNCFLPHPELDGVSASVDLTT